MFNALKAGKDKIIASTAKSHINGLISRYGELQSFSINTTDKTMQGSIALKGEPQALDVSVGSYRIQREDELLRLVVGDIRTSREWLNLAIADMFASRPELAAIPIADPSIAKLLESVL